MGTRATLIVENEDLNWNSPRTQMYRHFDGYPSTVLPSLHRALEMADRKWQAGRTGHAAAFIIAEGFSGGEKYGPNREFNFDPGTSYEPEDYGTVHADIEFLYLIRTVHTGKHPGSVNSGVRWEVKVYIPCRRYWDEVETSDGLEGPELLEWLIENKMELIVEGDLDDLLEKIDEIDERRSAILNERYGGGDD